MPIPGGVALELCLLTETDCDPDDPLGWIVTPTSEIVLEPPTDTTEPGLTTESPIVTTTVPPIVTTTVPPIITTTVPPIVTTTVPPVVTTPVPTDSCTNISLGGYVQTNKTVSLTITNNNANTVAIDKFYLTWNDSTNGLLEEIYLGDNRLWGQGQTNSASPADITIGHNAHRTIDAGGSETLSFVFENDASALLSSLTIYFDIGCSKSK
jgi:hypothetical protein